MALIESVMHNGNFKDTLLVLCRLISFMIKLLKVEVGRYEGFGSLIG